MVKLGVSSININTNRDPARLFRGQLCAPSLRFSQFFEKKNFDFFDFKNPLYSTTFHLIRKC